MENADVSNDMHVDTDAGWGPQGGGPTLISVTLAADRLAPYNKIPCGIVVFGQGDAPWVITVDKRPTLELCG
jgi:hypothetical protein